MAISAQDKAFVTELFDAVGEITTGHMMGGLNIYADRKIFAVVDSKGQLFLKADGDFAKRLQAAGSSQFTFTLKSGKQGAMKYWTLPEAALDDPEQATDWAEAALIAAYG